jgi:Flp pilus assembly protein TadG
MRGGREDRGQATVEFALVLPLLVICVAGIVWVGQVITLQLRLEHAAREGARAAVVSPDSALQVAEDAVARSFPAADGVTTVVGPEFVEVRVWTRVAGVPFVGVGSRELVADAHMRREDLLG